MPFARRVRHDDDYDEPADDYAVENVITADKRFVPAKGRTPYDVRLAKLKAIAILQRAGVPNDEIATAVGLSERHVRRRIGLIRKIAEARGRV